MFKIDNSNIKNRIKLDDVILSKITEKLPFDKTQSQYKKEIHKIINSYEFEFASSFVQLIKQYHKESPETIINLIKNLDELHNTYGQNNFLKIAETSMNTQKFYGKGHYDDFTKPFKNLLDSIKNQYNLRENNIEKIIDIEENDEYSFKKISKQLLNTNSEIFNYINQCVETNGELAINFSESIIPIYFNKGKETIEKVIDDLKIINNYSKNKNGNITKRTKPACMLAKHSNYLIEKNYYEFVTEKVKNNLNPDTNNAEFLESYIKFTVNYLKHTKDLNFIDKNGDNVQKRTLEKITKHYFNSENNLNIKDFEKLFKKAGNIVTKTNNGFYNYHGIDTYINKI